MVPPRPAARRQPRAARRLRRATACCRCSCSTRRCGARPGVSRRAYLAASLRALDASLRQRHAGLSVVRGDPVRQVVLAAQAGRREPGARRRRLRPLRPPARRARSSRRSPTHGIELVRTGSPYAVAPGRVRNGRGDPYKVYTPFSRAWAEHGWRDPVDAPTGVTWLGARRHRRHPRRRRCPPGSSCPRPARRPRCERWQAYVERATSPTTTTDRDRPDLDTTSPDVGAPEVGRDPPAHDARRPRAAAPAQGATTYRKELAWREFYADVLFQRPGDRAGVPPARVRRRWSTTSRATRLDAWREGRTGFPIVDAGMRQLRATGWMHNRVRMIVASFLVKDLHVEWQHGARHFMQLARRRRPRLQPARLAVGGRLRHRRGAVLPGLQPDHPGRRSSTRTAPTSAAGCPSCATSPTKHVHEPSARPDGLPDGYPAPIVDHAEERREALARYERDQASERPT